MTEKLYDVVSWDYNPETKVATKCCTHIYNVTLDKAEGLRKAIEVALTHWSSRVTVEEVTRTSL